MSYRERDRGWKMTWKQHEFNRDHLEGDLLIEPLFVTDYSVSSDSQDDPLAREPMRLWRQPEHRSRVGPTMVMAQDLNQQTWVQVQAYMEFSQEDDSPELIIPLVDSDGMPLIDPCRPPAIHYGRWDGEDGGTDWVDQGVANPSVTGWTEFMMGLEINTSWDTGWGYPLAPAYELVRNSDPFPHWDLRIRFHYKTIGWPPGAGSHTVVVDVLASPGMSRASGQVFEFGNAGENGHYKILVPWLKQQHFAPVDRDAFNSPQYGVAGVAEASPQSYNLVFLTDDNTSFGQPLFRGANSAAWLGELPACMVYAEGFPRAAAAPPAESDVWLTTLVRGMNGQTMNGAPLRQANFNQSAYGSRLYWDNALTHWVCGIGNLVANNQNQSTRSYILWSWGFKDTENA